MSIIIRKEAQSFKSEYICRTKLIGRVKKKITKFESNDFTSFLFFFFKEACIEYIQLSELGDIYIPIKPSPPTRP